MYVEFDSSAESHVHSVPSSKEIYIGIGDTGLEELMIIDGGGRKQFVHLKGALHLPAT